MRNYLFLASILLVSLNAHAQNKDYYVIPKDVKCMVKKSDKLTYCYDLKGRPITGEMRRYRNGDLRHSYFLKKGILDGTSTTYFTDGSINIQKTYTNGKLNGITKKNYKNGNPEEETSYVKGVKEGVSKKYYETGGLLSQTVYKNDKVNGDYRIYDTSQNIIYNLKVENSLVKSGMYHYLTKENKKTSSQIPDLIIQSINNKCSEIHISFNTSTCAITKTKTDDGCNMKWYQTNQKALDEYLNSCQIEEE